MEKAERALWPHHDDTDDVDGCVWIGASAGSQAGFDSMGYFRPSSACCQTVLCWIVLTVAEWKFRLPALDAENLAPVHRSAA